MARAVDVVPNLHTDDVDAAYEAACEGGYEIVHPLTTESWGIRPFFVRSPDGHVVNVAAHDA